MLTSGSFAVNGCHQNERQTAPFWWRNGHLQLVVPDGEFNFNLVLNYSKHQIKLQHYSNPERGLFRFRSPPWATGRHTDTCFLIKASLSVHIFNITCMQITIPLQTSTVTDMGIWIWLEATLILTTNISTFLVPLFMSLIREVTI